MVQTCKEFKEKVKNGKQTADDDLKFHKVILEATHNPFVIRIGLTILQLFRALISNSMKKIPQQALPILAMIGCFTPLSFSSCF